MTEDNTKQPRISDAKVLWCQECQSVTLAPPSASPPVTCTGCKGGT